MHDCIPFATQTIRTVMRAPVVTINQAASVGTALCLMRRHTVQCLAVVDHAEQLCGIITYGDIRRLKTLRILQLDVPAIADVLQRIAVHEVMTRQPLAVCPETSLREASQMMVEHKISGLPVVDPAGAIIGMVTERDLFEALVRHHDQELDIPRSIHQLPFTLEPQVACV